MEPVVIRESAGLITETKKPVIRNNAGIDSHFRCIIRGTAGPY